MYGTVGRYKFKKGTTEEVMSKMDEMREMGSAANGAVALFVLRMDRDLDEVFVVAISESEEAYRAAANDPEVNARYDFMSQYFAEEPQWNDGHVIRHDIIT